MEQHVCPWWLCYTFDNPLRRLFHDPERMFAPYLGAGQEAADIGCGMGFFTLGLARLAGPEGRVYALDLQPEMLSRVKQRAARAGLGDRIETRQVRPDSLGGEDLAGRLDMVLAFWMLHEVPDQADFLAQVKGLLKPGGAFFLAEPRFHVSGEEFASSLELAEGAGLHQAEELQVRLSRGVLLKVL